MFNFNDDPDEAEFNEPRMPDEELGVDDEDIDSLVEWHLDLLAERWLG